MIFLTLIAHPKTPKIKTKRLMCENASAFIISKPEKLSRKTDARSSGNSNKTIINALRT